MALNKEVNQERGRRGARKQERGKGISQGDSRGSAGPTDVPQAEKPDENGKARL